MDGAHGLPKDAIGLANELQQVLHGVGTKSVGNEIKPYSAYGYDHRVI